VDVTAFLSLMVILVPFLLVTAVFSRTSILELQPAVNQGAEPALPDPLQLQVTIRQDMIEVSYRGQSEPVQIDRSTDKDALGSLAAVAADLKTRHPANLKATLLLEPQIPYDELIQVLDILRVRLHREENTLKQESLFPLIALGEAPGSVQRSRVTP
jgi:biopolymer transport protein ExbD